MPNPDAPSTLAARAGSALQERCGHCGQLILGAPIAGPGDSLFCCEGCKTVSVWLKESNRDHYYELLDQAGKKAPQAHAGEAYRAFLASLDEPGLIQGLGRWRGPLHDLTLECGEIVCAGCGWLLENVMQGRAGVRTFDVDFIHGEAHLEYDSGITSLKEILAGIAALGYRLKPKSASAPVRPLPDRALLFRLAVSGACFANAMAFSLAVYLGAFHDAGGSWRHLFGLLGFALSLPAVIYSASPFFAGAWRAARAGRFNIDVTLSIGIALSFALSAYSLARGDAGNFSDSLTGLIFFLLLGRWAIRRFEAGLALKGRWFEALRPGKVRLRHNGKDGKDGKVELREAAEVAAGDVLEVLSGEYVPMDGRLQSDEAWFDTSLLTGESRPARFAFGDAVYAGYLNLKGRVGVRAGSGAGDNRADRLASELDKLMEGRRSIPDGVGKTAKRFTLAVAACGLIALWWHRGEGLGPALAAAASVFIISCSCALALAAPISRGLGLKRALALGFHFRSQNALEALRDIRCVLFDKTGTLTFTRRSVSAWEWAPGCEDPAFRRQVTYALRSLARNSLHPVALSLFQSLESAAQGDWILAACEEVPHFGLLGRFSDREGRGAGRGGKGGREMCLCRSGARPDAEAFRGRGYAVPRLGPEQLRKASASDSWLFLDGELIAVIGFTDEIKPEVSELTAALAQRGVSAALLSGDNSAKVEAFAAACGFEEYRAGLSPEDKARWAQELRGRHGACLAVGDGFNDSLLFGASDLAMAIQGGAVDLSKGTDILFTGARLSRLPDLFALADRVRRSIRLSFWVSGFYNAAAIAVAMRGGVTPLFAAVLMPVSSLSLCAVAWLTIRAPTQGKAVRRDPDVPA